jgi:hypothetical protein
MCYRVQLGPRLRQPAPPAFGVVDEAVDRSDRRHADIHPRHPGADLGTKMVPGDDRQEQRLVAHHQMRLAAERRREAGDRRLHLRGVGAVQQQQTADQQREVRDFLNLRRIGTDRLRHQPSDLVMRDVGAG